MGLARGFVDVLMAMAFMTVASMPMYWRYAAGCGRRRRGFHARIAAALADDDGDLTPDLAMR